MEYATGAIDVIVQVGRRSGKRGVLEVALPANVYSNPTTELTVVIWAITPPTY